MGGRQRRAGPRPTVVARLQAVHPTGVVLEATGGRAHVRAALSMRALAATRSTPVIRAFSQRLCAAGHATTVALTACPRC